MRKVVLLFTMVFVTSLVIFSCSSDDSGMEGLEGTEQGGENHGNENGSEQGESGTRWSSTATADETINGIRAIITFNTSTNAFEGTFENLNSNVAQQTRLEVHVFDTNGNSTEYGPTPGVDMQPNETRNLTLSIPVGTNFVEFTMHPEVGAAGSGG
jgi:hypothetical protein